MKINYNTSAVFATNALTRNDNRLQTSLERLSTGFKINNAKDNPSGLAMAKRMNAQIEGLDQATMNSNDGISIIEIADGTLGEIHDMLQRINELAVKASTGTVTDEDRELIDVEVKQLKEEISRIASESEFNGQKILDGSFDLKGYTNQENVKVTYYSDSIISGNYDIKLDVAFDGDGFIEKVNSFTGDSDFPPDAVVKQIDGNIVTIGGSQGFELKLRVTPLKDGDTGFNAEINLDLTGFGSMDMQIGANQGQQLGIIIPEVSLENMGISTITMESQESSKEALGRMSGAIKYVSSVRSGLGAYQNRLEHTINSLDVTSENMTGAYSRIMDTDMAEEMTEYTTMQVLSQASTSMLAQANERPSQVLQLLQ